MLFSHAICHWVQIAIRRIDAVTLQGYTFLGKAHFNFVFWRVTHKFRSPVALSMAAWSPSKLLISVGAPAMSGIISAALALTVTAISASTALRITVYYWSKDINVHGPCCTLFRKPMSLKQGFPLFRRYATGLGCAVCGGCCSYRSHQVFLKL